MIKIVGDNFQKSEFNKVARHPMQSWEWGEARKKMGIEVVRIAEYENNKLKNTYQMTLHAVPFLKNKLGYIPRSSLPSNEVLEFLYNYARQQHIVYIKFEPYVKKESEFNPRSKIIKSSFSLFPDWTIQLDLTKSEEQLLKNMKPKTRYNLRIAQKHGVAIRDMTNDDGFEIFSKLYFETCKRQHYHGHNINYHRTLFEALGKSHTRILVALYKSKSIAAYELFVFNDILYYPYGGSSTEHKNIMAPNLLMWESIRLGKKLGCRIFDMWGSLSPEYKQSDPWSGFTRFKEGYGGSFVEMTGSHDLVARPILYRLYSTVQYVRNKLLYVV